MIERDWFGCYGEGWTGLIDPSAFAHPAKFARGLIRRIYDHLFEQGYLKEGDTIIDPFAGVALGALHGMQHGCHWVGVELESRFVDLGRRNIDLWLATYAPHFPKWGSAVILQGDSRDLCAVVGQAAEVSVSSPPFGDSDMRKGGSDLLRKNRIQTGRNPLAPGTISNLGQNPYGSTDSNLGNLRATDADHRAAVQAAVSSAPYAGGCRHTGGDDPKPERVKGGTYHGVGLNGAVSSAPYAGSLSESDGIDWDKAVTESPANRHQAKGRSVSGDYGCSPGQLGAMKEGSFQAAVSSSPYVQMLKGGEGPGARYDFVSHSPENAVKQTCDPDYGSADGQLAIMPAGDHGAEVRGCVASPPYEEGLGHKGVDKHPERACHNSKLRDMNRYGAYADDSPNNLGNTTGDTFWSAARAVLEQTHRLLAPGAVAVWVCKRFVRDKAIVDFSAQWAELCEAVGFETIEQIKAWLTEDRGAQYTLSGDLEERQVKRCSFFRRLHESKFPDLAIDWEDVIIMRKPD